VLRVRSGRQFGARYGYTDNDATDSVYSYERHRVAIGLSRLLYVAEKQGAAPAFDGGSVSTPV